jgi:hypothetical protein
MKAFIDVQQKRYNSQNLENMVSDFSFVTFFLTLFPDMVVVLKVFSILTTE